MGIGAFVGIGPWLTCILVLGATHALPWFGGLAVNKAYAHPGHSRTQRMLKLDLESEPRRFTYGLLLNPVGTETMRKRADLNKDGQVSEVEAQQVTQALTAEFASKLTLCHGPTPEQRVCAPAQLEQVLHSVIDGWVGDEEVPLVMSWAVALELRSDDTSVQVIEDWSPVDITRTGAKIVPHPAQPLLQAGAGRDQEQPAVLEFHWAGEGQPSPRVLQATWQGLSAPVLPVLLGGLAVALAVGFFLWRKRRSEEELDA